MKKVAQVISATSFAALLVFTFNTESSAGVKQLRTDDLRCTCSASFYVPIARNQKGPVTYVAYKSATKAKAALAPDLTCQNQVKLGALKANPKYVVKPYSQVTQCYGWDDETGKEVVVEKDSQGIWRIPSGHDFGSLRYDLKNRQLASRNRARSPRFAESTAISLK